jgi:hypothetical protein
MNIINTYHSELLKYKNIHKDEVCYIFGSGTTINNFKIKENGVFIGCNHIIKNLEIKNKLKYYFFGHGYLEHTNDNSSNGYGNHKNEVDELGNHITKFCMVSRNNDISIHKFTPNDILKLKNINALPCDMNLTNINVELEHMAFLNHSIVFPAIQFALYSGFTKIYLVGCDCNGFFHSQNFLNNRKQNPSIDMELIHWWKQMYNFKKKNYGSRQIININPIGLKNLMDDDIYT